MSNKATHVICDPNLSYAWGKVFLEIMDATTPALNPITLCIDQLDGKVPPEDMRIREALDRVLKTHERKSCWETAATIFPYKTWLRLGRPKHDEFLTFYWDEYLPRHMARVKVRGGKVKETYFSRMIKARGLRRIDGKEEIREVRQLEYIISEWHQNPKRRPRHSSLMVSCFDPAKDQIGSAQGGFPCLHEVSFGYDDEGQFAVNAFYPTEYIIDRAYGNYLGLCHLGLFMAEQLGLKLARFNCFIGRPERGALKKDELRELEGVVENVLAETQTVQNQPKE